MRLYELAQRFVGEVHEVEGLRASPFIAWCHESCNLSDTSDEIPWCSSFLNRLAWLLRLPRSKSAAARSWLTVGVPVLSQVADVGDIVILKRGVGVQPGPEVLQAPGHVTLFAGVDQDGVHFLGLGGNQQNGVTVSRFRFDQILGVRRLT